MFLFSCRVRVQYNYRNRGSLTFEPLTLVPIQVKMMNTELLTQKEVRISRVFIFNKTNSTSMKKLKKKPMRNKNSLA